MRRQFFAFAWLTAGLVCAPAWGQAVLSQQEEMQWLQRIANAAQKLSYSGTFVYRSGSQSETSRIVHVSGNGNQHEKIEVLDGSPREVVRRNNEVKCYLPESRLLIVEQRSTHRAFPALLPMSLAGLGKHYAIRKNGNTRIAGFDSQIIRLEPRDAWRYGHQFWVDQETGLLLKADMFDAQGETLESLAFTELRIGEPASPDALKPSYSITPDKKDSWRIRQARLSDLRDDAQWQFRVELPGFRREASMRRHIVQDGSEAQEVLHWVFSDGLAAMSVFISPLRKTAEAGSDEVQSNGAFSVARRVVERHQVVVMGEVPPATVKQFADGIGMRGK